MLARVTHIGQQHPKLRIWLGGSKSHTGGTLGVPEAPELRMADRLSDVLCRTDWPNFQNCSRYPDLSGIELLSSTRAGSDSSELSDRNIPHL